MTAPDNALEIAKDICDRLPKSEVVKLIHLMLQDDPSLADHLDPELLAKLPHLPAIA